MPTNSTAATEMSATVESAVAASSAFDDFLEARTGAIVGADVGQTEGAGDG